ncbi:MAG: threonylcarbamoyl-AMP synthase [Planctomycetaceae bacterium]|nr:threonylcarbamoyl-AMP synthase [Planctomycetaceae bacterium]
MSRIVEIGDDLTRAADEINRGQLVAMPTETVYGLAANALNPLAVARIFEAKQRPEFDPLIVHIASYDSLELIAKNIPEIARKLMDQFWPGPLTLVFPKTEAVPDLVTSGLNTVAVRMPDHPLALQLIRDARCPLAAPSANLFGRTSPTTAQHVADQLGDRLAYILDGGPCKVGIESTIISIENERLSLLRPGGITIEQLQDVLGPGTIEIPNFDTTSEEHPVAPGQLKEHYAPLTPLIIQQQLIRPDRGQRIGLLTLQLPEASHQNMPETFETIEELSATGDLTEAASNFFAAIRRLDAENLDLILATPFPSHGLGLALNDRLNRAAHR